MLEINVKLSGDQVLLDALNALAAAFKTVNPTPQVAPSPPPLPAGAPVSGAPTAPTVPTTAQAATPPMQQPAVPVAPSPTFSRDQIMTAGAALIDAGKINELMDLLNAFGVQAVTQLKAEQLGAFATELRKLGAQI